jgi:probable F420-dependent oxidoreductase
MARPIASSFVRIGLLVDSVLGWWAPGSVPRRRARRSTIAGMKIGLMLPIGQQDLLRGPDRWSTLRDMAIAADTGGLDSVWCADHLLFRDADGDETDGIHEAWTVLSAVAALTTRVEIGPLVLCVPFRNPALTAKMATTLDEVSGGRLILGLGCGWHEPEFDAFGYEFDHRVSQFAEALEIIVPMLRTGTASFAGHWQRAADAAIVPPGPRQAGPPILIAGKGPRMLDLVARHADAWNAAWYGRPEAADELRERIANVRDALARAGRDPSTLELTAGIHVAVADAPDAPDDAIAGSTEEIAAARAGYAELGVTHLVAHCWPRSAAAVTQLGAAAALARERVSVGAASV